MFLPEDDAKVESFSRSYKNTRKINVKKTLILDLCQKSLIEVKDAVIVGVLYWRCQEVCQTRLVVEVSS